VALPHTAHARRRHRQPPLLQLVGDPDLAKAGCSTASATTASSIS
jgi:hypothetical protein